MPEERRVEQLPPTSISGMPQQGGERCTHISIEVEPGGADPETPCSPGNLSCLRAPSLHVIGRLDEPQGLVVGVGTVHVHSKGDVVRHVRVVVEWVAVLDQPVPQARRHLTQAIATDRPQVDGRDLRDFLERHGTTLRRQTSDIVDQVGSGLRIPMVKALAEAARNAVSRLRRARYDLLGPLSTEIRKGSTRQLEWYLCGLLELSTVANHAQDRARVAVREGLYLWQSDDGAYHAQRRLMDPTLAARPGTVDGSDRPWFALYDAAIRQCVSMERQLAEEAASLHDVLGAASTIAVTRDARSQDVFNVIAVAGSVVLGLPALLLTLYGMQGEGLPLSGWAMLIVTAVLAGSLAQVASQRRGLRMRPFFAGALAALAVGGLLFLATRIRGW